MKSEIYYVAARNGFIQHISRLGYITFTCNVREALVFSSFEEADVSAKATFLKNHYYAILNPQEILK